MDTGLIQKVAGLAIIGLVAYLWAWRNDKKAAVWVLVGALFGWAVSLFASV